ncbi:YkgJ family cysteine cluster protein [Avibacterium paragallinarum]|uniref:YkgJ family cysteine cluster protein n=1 Tax=Avibacterium paragallinarum TaxID=728 RepID=UPI00397C853B
MNNLTNFPCNACGKCCQKVGFHELTKFLDRGDGTCFYFDEKTNLCQIYKSRPLICRVKDYYLENLSHKYSWSEFIRLNIEVCEILQKE